MEYEKLVQKGTLSLQGLDVGIESGLVDLRRNGDIKVLTFEWQHSVLEHLSVRRLRTVYTFHLNRGGHDFKRSC